MVILETPCPIQNNGGHGTENGHSAIICCFQYNKGHVIRHDVVIKAKMAAKMKANMASMSRSIYLV